MGGLFDDLFQKDWEEEAKQLQKKYDRLVSDASDLEKEIDLSNKRNIRQSQEIDECIGLIDKLRSKVSDADWTEAVEENKKQFEAIRAKLLEDENGQD
jgi:uncharacterized coiled-coil DUF342 family protein